MGGIFAQTIVFGAFGVAIALAHDRTNGAIDRFRSLPLGARRGARRPRGGEPAARPAADPPHVDLRPDRRLADRTRRWPTPSAAYALMLAFSFAIIWVGVLLGSLLPTPEAVQGVAFVVIFPVTFIASTLRADATRCRAC